MRKLMLVCMGILCFSLSGLAKNAPAALDPSSPASDPAIPQGFTPSDRDPWQITIGYQYQHFNVLGQTFHTNGLNVGLTRYVNNWFGFEGAVAMGFGGKTSPLGLSAKSFFIGGGPHIAVHNGSRFEPWAHFLVGWQHFRFTQTPGILGSNSALGLMGGGGVDIKVGERVYWRIEGNYIGTRFQSTMQRNYSVGSGLVFNF